MYLDTAHGLSTSGVTAFSSNVCTARVSTKPQHNTRAVGVLLLHEFDITSACTASRNPVPSTVQADYYSKSWRGTCTLYASIKHANATASLGAVRLQHGHPYSKQRSSTRPCHGKHCRCTNRAIYMQVDFEQDDSNMHVRDQQPLASRLSRWRAV